ncbi:tRNA-splicing endonuclease subunit sen54 [Microbotryomycetes sp. JL201]|nr:tRNA-splicing endonuclease subunit sen54 [Microbotryomycetes sp. JL201]
MEDDRPTATLVDAEEAEEEALPDWSQFAKLASASKNKQDASIPVPFIPKRGEKDFEPITPDLSALPATSKQATLSQHQINQLTGSRNAYFAALASGSRHHSSRAHNSFTWRPELDGGRATCDSDAVYGVHFGSIGRYNVQRKRLELLPEEVLYLVERGAVELWQAGGCEDGGRVPMSVQETWDQVMGTYDLNLERYQVYTFLKRLGYTVIRAREEQKSLEIPATTVTLWERLNRISLAAFHWFFSFTRRIKRLPSALWNYLAPSSRLVLTRTLGSTEGQARSLLSARRWSSYDSIFSHLQIVPSGWDRKLPRAILPRNASALTPFVSHAPSNKTQLVEEPYQEFYHVYKPITKFKKSAPLPPDFRLVVVNGSTTSMPDVFEFASMFDAVPLPIGEDTLLPPPRIMRQGLPANARAARPPRRPAQMRNVDNSNKWLTKLTQLVPFLGPKDQTRKPSPYPRLKTGRRDILVAVVDNGTISILRFNESEFAKLPWNGRGRHG